MGTPVMAASFILLSLLALSSMAEAHKFYPGQCPQLTPMSDFDWTEFANGTWFVTRKFATRSSCLVYQFQTDLAGSRSVKQIRKLPFSDKLPLDTQLLYTGKLSTPQESSPARMVVRFPLNLLGASSFVVLDTDYQNSALLCTCQDLNLFITKAHRRSCSILQRKALEDTSIIEQMFGILDSQLDDASHDFNRIKQEDCDYGEDGFKIDVDKILGAGDQDGAQPGPEVASPEFAI